MAVTTHERIRLCVLSTLYLMVMDKLSVAYHLMLGLGFDVLVGCRFVELTVLVY